eukprot:TRINITY_DN12307_c0_g1_i1.p2 TRINITY_DN12307_c0_g1~~TRINITY_DN12307_c0_g1_i1.p2  ORF type:complete len:108 (-),score=26.35 TRINITY_DN12307_c0_g1_i1:101-424(-)
MASSSLQVSSDQRWEMYLVDAMNGLFTTEELKAQTFLREVEEEYHDLEEWYRRKSTRDHLRAAGQYNGDNDPIKEIGYHLEMPDYEAHIYLWEVDTSKKVELRIKHD